MKKLISLFMVAILIFALSACSTKKDVEADGAENGSEIVESDDAQLENGTETDTDEEGSKTETEGSDETEVDSPEEEEPAADAGANTGAETGTDTENNKPADSSTGSGAVKPTEPAVKPTEPAEKPAENPSTGNVGSGAEASTGIDLTGFYDSIASKYEGFGGLIDIEGEYLDSCYPGLSDIETVQLIAKMPMISAVVNEIVLVECANEEDVAKVAEIFKARINDQAGGGAWYPASMEAWSKAQVITNGSYAAMITNADVAAEFSALFA